MYNWTSSTAYFKIKTFYSKMPFGFTNIVSPPHIRSWYIHLKRQNASNITNVCFHYPSFPEVIILQYVSIHYFQNSEILWDSFILASNVYWFVFKALKMSMSCFWHLCTSGDSHEWRGVIMNQQAYWLKGEGVTGLMATKSSVLLLG